MGSEWVAMYFCPALGTIICNIMWTSPFKAILEVRKNNKMGSLNPIPFGITVINCIGWVLYGILRRDYFLFFSNIFGLVLGLFYCLSSLSVLSVNSSSKNIETRNILEFMLLFSVILWGTVGLIIGIIIPPSIVENGIFAVGILGCCCGLAYYGSFLSTMTQIIRLKDSSSLYFPTLIANLSNATLWVIYGFAALNDPIVWVPNFIGATLTCIQISLYFIYYPNKKYQGDTEYVLSNQNHRSDVSNPLGETNLTTITDGDDINYNHDNDNDIQDNI